MLQMDTHFIKHKGLCRISEVSGFLICLPMDLIVLGRGKLFYKPFPLPKSWRVWTNTMGLGRENYL